MNGRLISREALIAELEREIAFERESSIPNTAVGAYKRAIARAKGLPAADEESVKWISVAERMPQDFVSVLAHMTDAGEFPTVREAYTVCGRFFFPALRENHPVDYWAEMPELPKEPVRKGRWKKGAIISGYQGIGKSTLARNRSGYIDLESGSFFTDGVRAGNWYKTYAQIAIHLARQGYRVFISSHREVRDYLACLRPPVDLYVCFPSLSLREAWIDKLRKRYAASGLDKDLRAFANAEDRYADNITELCESRGFTPVMIHDINYCLEDLLDSHCGAKMRGEESGADIQNL